MEIYASLGSQNKAALELYSRSLDKLGRQKDLLGQLSRWLEVDRDNPVLREYYASVSSKRGSSSPLKENSTGCAVALPLYPSRFFFIAR